MPAAAFELGWIDWTLLAVLALSVLVGLWRGFVFECLSLAGWVAAWFGAQWLAPVLASHVPIGAPGSALNLAVAFGLGFLAALLVWSIAARLVRMLIHATPLSIPDRLLGGGFGVLRGGVLLLALATLVALTPAAQSTSWRASTGARWLGQTLHVLKPLLPEPAARLLRT
jgi:membrane protein required for colicin V production